jgi:hypothetical protein
MILGASLALPPNHVTGAEIGIGNLLLKGTVSIQRMSRA